MGSGPTARRRQSRATACRSRSLSSHSSRPDLSSAGVVSGAGPLAVLVTASDTTSATRRATQAPRRPTSDSTTTQSTTTETTTHETTSTETTESTTTDTSPLPTGPPTIASDKNDYAPGETVTLTGDHWVPAEVVHIVVNDDQQKPWVRKADVIARTSGAIYHQFQLPDDVRAHVHGHRDRADLGEAHRRPLRTATSSSTRLPATPAATPVPRDSPLTPAAAAPEAARTATRRPIATARHERREQRVAPPRRASLNANAPNCEQTCPAPGAAPTALHRHAGAERQEASALQASRRHEGPDRQHHCQQAPTANNVSDSTNEDTPKAITLSGSDAAAVQPDVLDRDRPANGALGSISDSPCTSGSPNTDTASVTYTPNANYNGIRLVHVPANDGSANSATATVSLTVNPVNDAPSFTKGADQTVDEDAGAQCVSGWATAISAGPANESGQTVSFLVTANSNPSLFSAAPAVSSTGTLTYTPAANAFGSATITLKARTTAAPPTAASTRAHPELPDHRQPGQRRPQLHQGRRPDRQRGRRRAERRRWATAISAGPERVRADGQLRRHRQQQPEPVLGRAGGQPRAAR